MKGLDRHRALAFRRGNRHFLILPAGKGIRGHVGLMDGVVVAMAPEKSVVANALVMG